MRPFVLPIACLLLGSNLPGAAVTLTPNVGTIGLVEGGGSMETTMTLSNPGPDVLEFVLVGIPILPNLVSGDGHDPVTVSLVHDNCSGKDLVPVKSCTFGLDWDPGDLDPEAEGADSNTWKETATAHFTISGTLTSITGTAQARNTDPCGTEESPTRTAAGICFPPPSIPEPSTVSLLSSGLAPVAFAVIRMRRFRRKQT